MDPSERLSSIDVLGRFLGSAVGNAFDLMELAEEEIAASEERWPLQAPVFHDCFLMLYPGSDLFNAKADVLYRKHCRELLDRVAKGGDHRDPTKAELACFLCESSQVAPLEHNASAFYMNVFRDLFPDNTFADEDYLYSGDWEGAVAELEQQMMRRLRRGLNRNPPGKGPGSIGIDVSKGGN